MQKSIGFGFIPALNENHFYMYVPKMKDGTEKIRICERFHWENGKYQEIREMDILKLEFPVEKWRKIKNTVEVEFNRELKADGLSAGKFKSGEIPLERKIGKELMILLWGLENCDISNIPTALTNWAGLSREERWYLYTMTNAATGGINDGKKGWRMALRYILCENPIM